MSKSDDLDSEMFTYPWQTRPDVRANERLLAGSCVPQEVPTELQPVADLLAALREPPARRDVTRWNEALVAYRETVSQPLTRPMPVHSRSPRARFRLAVISGAALASLLGGGVAAAYSGSLPAALQNFAHHAIAAPAVSGTRTPAAGRSGHGVGPSASARSAYGLCTAYAHATQHGNAAQRSVALRNLVAAAGGPGKVAAYCAQHQHPGPVAQHGRHVGRGGTPAHSPGHHGKPVTGPGSGQGNGNGNGKGSGSSGSGGTGSGGSGGTGSGGKHGGGNGKPKQPK